MASFSQPQFFSSLTPIKKNNFTLSPQRKNFPTIKPSKIPSSKTQSSPNSQENPADSQPHEEDPVKLALAKAKAYKNSVKSGVPTPKILQNPEISGKKDGFQEFDEIEDGGVEKEVPLAVKYAMEKAKEYKKSKIIGENEGVVSDIVRNSGAESTGVDGKNDKDEGGGKEIPLSVKLALEKAKEYKKDKAVPVVSSDNGGVVETENLVPGLKGGNERSAGDKQSVKSSGKKEGLSVSSIDFMGLGFADKKSGRDLPAGLVPLSDPFPEGELPEVEILVGDMTNFGDKSAAPIEEDDTELYKPKVSTWGVFPRPNNISKTYGGGRTLRPGEALETPEERAAKEARTRQLIAAYKSQIGLNIDPKLKSECEKALKDGDSLMDLGKLKEALPFYESVMEKMVFKSELHGLAALQWSVCQDSLSRTNEARVMYEKLQSHPSPRVSKKARQFYFSFQGEVGSRKS
ncbi:cytochrome C oxidase subunit [Perilla frutescens var. hirtella]|uniref:Cytochrome C oxidase subunit n=1 Tax=Perilla frutescens var. hirtella TaxID=608512 RepID=A0AAD4P2L4_PERFH|nr:cytochrome C oxidase subunit [Perilla frutescens var. hirtella]